MNLHWSVDAFMPLEKRMLKNEIWFVFDSLNRFFFSKVVFFQEINSFIVKPTMRLKLLSVLYFKIFIFRHPYSHYSAVVISVDVAMRFDC